MTVSTTANTVVYIGNGATTEFAVPFLVLDVEHLVVKRRVLETRVVEETYSGSDYSYDGIGDPAGTLTLDGDPLEDEYELVIERRVPYTQDLDIVNAGGFYPETVEEQLDLLEMQIQQNKNAVDRAPKVPIGAGEGPELLWEEAEDGQVLARINDRIVGIDNDTGSAADYAEDAANSAAAALVSEEAAEAAATASGVSAAQSSAAAELAATYLAAFNLEPDMWFDDEPTGRAAVADGEKFAVIDTSGYKIYERVDAGSSTLLSYMPSFGVTGYRQFIKCTASTAGHSNNDFSITPVDAQTVYTGDGTQYVWVFESPVKNSVGSGGVSVTVKNGAGVTFATMALQDINDVTLSPNDLEIGDLLHVRRATAAEDATQQLRWLRPSDPTKKMAAWSTAIDDFGERGSTTHPLMVYKTGVNERRIMLRIDESKYGVGMARMQSDQVVIVEQDLASFMDRPADESAWHFNSVFANGGAASFHFLNMLYKRLIEGLEVDTGRSPTAIEPPIEGGEFGNAVNLYKVAGMTHGNVIDASTAYVGTVNDATTAGDETVNLDPFGVLQAEFQGHKLVKTLDMLCVNAAADVWARQTHTVTYQPREDDTIIFESVFDFDDAEVTVTPGFIRGFSMIFAGTGVDRCRAVVNGVPQDIEVIDLRDDSPTLLGFPEKVIFWHSEYPTWKIIVENLAGYGFTHWEDDGGGYVLVANGDSQSYVSNFENYVKLYGGLYGDHGGSPVPVDMSGKKLKSRFSWSFEKSAAEV